MPTNRVRYLLIVASLAAGLFIQGQSANAASWTWGYNSTSAYGALDGSGTWDTTSPNWATGGLFPVSPWNSVNNSAWFGVGDPASNPYNVDLGSGTLGATGITFNNQAYTISDGTLNINSFGSAGIVAVNSLSGGTISATFIGPGLTKSGNGSLTITNPQSLISGATKIQGGTLVLAAANNILSPSGALVLGSTSNVNGVPTIFNSTLDLAGFSQSCGSLGTGFGVTAANQTIGNSVASTTATLTITGSSIFGGSIQDGLNGLGGQVALKVSGTGQAILSGVNTYTGGTLISGNASLLEAVTTASLPGWSTTGNVSVTNSATLAVGVGGPGQFAAADIGTLLGVPGLFAAGTSLGIDTSGGSLAYPSNIGNSGAGALGLIKLGSNALSLSGANTYSGSTRINSGVLSLANAAALSGGGNITFAGGTLQYTNSNNVDYSGRFVNSTSASPISIDLNGQSVTFASGLAGSNSGGLTVNSSVPGGILTLSASNGYSGKTVINGGVLSLANSAALSGGTAAVTFAGGTLQYTASNKVDCSSRIANSAGPIAIDANGQNVMFASGLLSSNSGGLTLNSTVAGGILTLAASNGYAGTTLVSGGTLLLASPNALSRSTLDTSGAGSLSFGGLMSANFGGLQGSGNLAVNNTSAAGVALNVGGNNISTTFSGQLSGSGSLSKTGSGLLFLNGTNNYTGSTAVSGGILQAATTAALPGWNSAGTVSVAGGATLAVSAGGPGQWTAVNLDTLRAAGSFAANANLGIDTSGASGGTFTYGSNITDTGANPLGLVKLGSNTLLFTGLNTYTGNTTISGGILQVGSSTALYAGTGAAGNVIANNGTLDLSGNTVTVGAISGSGAVIDSFGGASLTFGNSSSSTFNGSLQMSTLTKNGTGAFVLAGPNNTTASTTITGGTFQIGNGILNGNLMGSSAYILTNNARLFLSQGTAAVTNLPLTGITGNGIIELKDAQTSGSVLYPALNSSSSLALTTGTLQVEGRGIVQATPAGLGGVTRVVVNSSGQFYASDGGTSGTAYVYPQNFTISGVGNSSPYNIGALHVNGMNATFSGSIALPASATIYADGTNTGLNITGVISGSGALTINDSINPVNNITPPIILSAANTYTGQTTQTGNLQLSNSAALQNSTWTTSSGGSLIFDVAGAGTSSFVFGGMTGPKSLVLSDTSGTVPIALSVGNNNTSPSAYTGILSGLGSLTKIGSGNLTLQNTASYSGATTISGGTLTLQTNSSIFTGAMLNPNGVIVDNGTLIFNRNSYTVQGNTAFPIVIQGIDFSSAAISGTGSLVEAGATPLVLTAANTYTGPTTVKGGTLYVNGSLSPSSTVIVTSAGTLAGSGSVPTTIVNSGGNVLGGYNGSGSLALASLTFSGSANTYGALGASTAPIIVNGALTTAGSAIFVNIAGRPAVSGIYPYLQYGSLVGTGGTAAFKLPTPVRAVSLVSTGNTLGVNFDALQYPIWTGTNSTAFSGGNNWMLAKDGSVTDYQNLDAVVFDDTAKPSATAVNISGSNVTPYSTTFNNSSLNYTLTGAFGIAGVGGLTKNGTGLLTIANTNSYTGGTLINSGTIALGKASGLPSAGALTLGSGTSNGTFDLTGFGQSLGTLAVGAGAVAANQIITNSVGSGTLTYNGTALNNAVSAFGGTIQDSAPSGGTLNLVVGSGTLDLTAGNPNYHGFTYTSGGVLKVSSLPNTSAIFNANELAFVGSNTIISAPIYGAGNITYSGGSGTLSSLITPQGLSAGYPTSLTVGGGVLTLASSSATFYNNVWVNGGGTLNVPSGGYLYQFENFGQGISFSVGNSFGPGTLVVSGGTVANYGGVTVGGGLPNCSLIISGGVMSCGLNGVNGTGGITIDGLCSVSGGLLSANGGTQGTCSIGFAGISGDTANVNVSGGTVSADGSITVASAGTAVFNQSGGLVTCGGSLALGVPDVVTHTSGGGTMNLSGGTLTAGIVYNGYASSSTINISGTSLVVSPTFSMGKASAGYSNPSIVNTLNLNGGTLQTNGIVNDGNGNDTNTVNFNGGLLLATAYAPNFLSGMTHAYVLAGGARINDGGNTVTIFQNLESGASPDGGLTKSGLGTLTLGGSNNYSGGTTVQEGELQLSSSSALGVGGLAVNGGTLDLEGYSVTVPSFRGVAGTVSDFGFDSGTTTLTVDQSSTTTFGGTIADGQFNLLALELSGPGKLILSGTNTYSGGTTVAAGTLVLASPSALANGSSLTVGRGAAGLFAPVDAAPSSLGASPAITAVPEPNTWALLVTVIGFAAVYCGLRRRISASLSA
jgi:fibronectin-binding autotransporter adhesin